MNTSENIESFVTENGKHFRDYIAARLEIYKLRIIGYVARSAGHIAWFVISLFLLFLFLVFLGLVTGFWLSDLTGSYIKGFGLTSGIILVVIVIIAMLRKQLFINPVIRMLIRNLRANKSDNKQNTQTGS